MQEYNNYLLNTEVELVIDKNMPVGINRACMLNNIDVHMPKQE